MMPHADDMLFRTLADPTRRALFERLCRDGEQTVGRLHAFPRSGQTKSAAYRAIAGEALGGKSRFADSGGSGKCGSRLPFVAPSL